MDIRFCFSETDLEELSLIMEKSARAGMPLHTERLKELLCGGPETCGILSLSPSGGACLGFMGSTVYLLTAEGIRPVMEDPFLPEGESSVFRVQWSEAEKMVRFEMHQTVHGWRRSAECCYSGKDCLLTLSDIQKEDETLTIG